MCRKGDLGPYEVGNVFIAPFIENSSVKPSKTSGLPRGVARIRGRYVAVRGIDGRTHFLGSFETAGEAGRAYLSFAPVPDIDSACSDAAPALSADLQPTIAELEAGWLMQPRVSELRMPRFESASPLPPGIPLTATGVEVGEPAAAVAFSCPDIPEFLRRSKNATTLRIDAATGIQVSSSSSDISSHQQE